MWWCYQSRWQKTPLGERPPSTQFGFWASFLTRGSLTATKLAKSPKKASKSCKKSLWLENWASGPAKLEPEQLPELK